MPARELFSTAGRTLAKMLAVQPIYVQTSPHFDPRVLSQESTRRNQGPRLQAPLSWENLRTPLTPRLIWVDCLPGAVSRGLPEPAQL